MKRFTNAVELAITKRNWHAAVFLTLTLPDICGKLQFPNKASGQRYKDWWDEYVLATYQAEMGPNRELHTFLSGGDAYALRCACLHEGGGDVSQQRAREVLDHFHFITPPRRSTVHCNQLNNTLQLQTDIFCRDVCDGVDKWSSDTNGDADVQNRISSLLIIHDGNGGLVI